jgi:hypothetical protein
LNFELVLSVLVKLLEDINVNVGGVSKARFWKKKCGGDSKNALALGVKVVPVPYRVSI